MRVPVFVSVPATLTPPQQQMKDLFDQLLEANGLEPRTVGRTDYPVSFPLKAVLAIARRCSGGLVLGFEQLRVTKGVRKPETVEETALSELPLATPWNQLEAGILFGLRLPMLVFRERGIDGGIFDPGASGTYVHPMPSPTSDLESLQALILQWRSAVQTHYYGDDT
jgi:hypothetical protein